MKKLLLVLLVLSASLFLNKAAAQWKGFSFGPYLEFAWPKGYLAQRNSDGIGLGMEGNIKLNKKLSAIGSVGYLRFGRLGRFAEVKTPALAATPVRFGVKYKMPLVYLKFETGAAPYTNGTGSPLILSPGVGLRVLGLDVQASYEGWMGAETLGFTSLRLAYHF